MLTQLNSVRNQGLATACASLLCERANSSLGRLPDAAVKNGGA
jgi:hypothetical protein